MHSLDALPEFILLDVAAQCSLASLEALLSTCRRLAALRWFGELVAWPQARWVGDGLADWPWEGEWPAVATDPRSAHAQWQRLVLRKHAAMELANLLLDQEYKRGVWGSIGWGSIFFGRQQALVDAACRVLPPPIVERALQAAPPSGIAFCYYCLRFLDPVHNNGFRWALDLEIKAQSDVLVWPESEHQGADWRVWIDDADRADASINERGFRASCSIAGTRAQVGKWLIYALAEQPFTLDELFWHGLTQRELDTLEQIRRSGILRWQHEA
jgi:hypothetical protein